MEVAALTPKGVVSFTARKVTDVPFLTFVKPFVASSELYVLAIWIDPAKLAEKNKESDPIKDFMAEGEGEGEGKFYIVRFDSDGSYKRALKLDFDFLPMQFAAFEDGGFLIGDLDKRRAAHVVMLMKGNKIEQKDQLACVYQGKFIGIRQTKGKLTLITGVAEPTTQNSEDVVQQQSLNGRL